MPKQSLFPHLSKPIFQVRTTQVQRINSHPTIRTIREMLSSLINRASLQKWEKCISIRARRCRKIQIESLTFKKHFECNQEEEEEKCNFAPNNRFT